MKRLSIGLPAIGLALLLFLSGSTPKPAAAEPSSTIKMNKMYMYYWYTAPDDSYNDYATLADESWEWMLLLGTPAVDTNPMGGTLIAKGYMTNNYPHIMYPAAYLYVHWTH